MNTDKIKSLLWKVSGAGLQEPSYIFGTHHISSMDICRKISGFDDAFSSVTAVYSEVELSQLESGADHAYFLRSMKLPKGNTLDEFYSPFELEQLNSLVRKYLHADISSFVQLKPAAIFSRLNLAQAMRSMEELGEESDQRLDLMLQERALEMGKELYGLETVRMQVRYLYNAPLEEQVQELLDYVTLGNDVGDYLTDLTSYYLDQDIDAINELMEDSRRSGTSETQLKRLVYTRNRKWVKILSAAFQKQSVFVLVGAGHLPGKNGLLRLFQKKGYQVEPVR